MQRVVIIASSRLGRAALANLLVDTEFEVVGAVAPGEPARAALSRSRPDLVLIDLASCSEVLDVLFDVGDHSRGAAAVVLADGDDVHQVVPAFQHGARGVLARERSCDELLAGLRTVVAGDVVIEPRLAAHLVLAVTRGVRVAGPYGLSRAEEAVVAQLAQELTNGQIGRRIGVSTSTVKTHLRHAFRKLGVRNRMEAALFAVERGLA